MKSKELVKIKSPLSVSIFLTEKCNQKCKFCYTNSGIVGEHISTDKAKTIIDKCAEAEVFDINFTGGEPTLHPDFADIVKYAKDYDFTIGFTSNGQFNAKTTREIVKYIDGATISIHGFRDLHDSLVNKKGSYDKAIRNLEILSDEGVITQVDYTLIKDNLDQLYPFGKFILEKPIHRLGVLRLIHVGRGKGVESPTIEEYNKAFSQMYKLRKEFKDKNIELADAFPYCLVEDERYRKLIRGCSAGVLYAAIDTKGNIKYCPAHKHSIGNIFEDSLEEIWQNNKELERYRKLDWVPESCKSCDYLGDCLLGCRASSEEEKDILLSFQNPSPLKRKKKNKKKNKEIKPERKPRLWKYLKIRRDLDGYIVYHPVFPILYINDIGREILKYCNGKNTIENIICKISEKYNIESKKAELDIESFLGKLGDFISYEA